jgi:hypothetical protein
MGNEIQTEKTFAPRGVSRPEGYVQAQVQVSLYEKPKTEIAELKKAGKIAHNQYMLNFFNEHELEAIFMQGTKNGTSYDFVSRHLIASPNKEISVILPSGASLKMQSENIASQFFGVLPNMVKKEMQRTDATKTKKGIYQIPLLVKY